MRKTILFIFGLLLVFNASMFVQGVTKVGTTAAPFLAIDVGPRATGMGGAYVSVANDATAMYWNPAGIARQNHFEAIFCNTRWIADLSYNYAAAVLPLGNVGNIGLHATFLNMDQIERTTVYSPEGTDEFFDAGSYAIGLSYARNLTDLFSIGFNVKFINERIYHCSASGFAADIGAIFDTRFNGIKLGMSISNYGTKMRLDGRDLQVQHDYDASVSGNNANLNAKYMTDSFDLPLMFRVGVSMDVLKDLYNSNLILAVDALHPSDDVESINLGSEYVLYDLFSLRAGYRELFSEDSESGLTFGAGMRYQLKGTTMSLSINYSYVDFGIFNAVHMFSVGMGI